jgi:hypothetical protein
MANEKMKEYVSYVKKYMKNRFNHDFVLNDLLEIIGGMEADN